MARRSKMRGDIRLRRTLRNIHKTMDNELAPAMRHAAERVLATQQQLMPKDTGAAAAALKIYVAPSGLDAQIGIRGKSDNRKFFYLRFIEYGTKGYIGGKRAGNRNRRATNKSDGTHFFGKYPDIPARPAHPWLRPSIDVNREYVMADIETAVRRTLRKASQGGAMADPSVSLQEAIFARLQAEVSCPVYDGAPMDADMPYVSIDREVSVNVSPISGRKREQRLLYLSVWSDTVGQAEVKRINGEVIAALDERPLPLSVGRAVSVRVIQSDAQRDADGVTYQGSITVRVITTH